jgi:cellulose synthase/poly-beta-1,6-N-acetylglucosamine synthase-like glycosyltransferase
MDLLRCLQALGQQSRRADQLVVVVRAGDQDSRLILASHELQSQCMCVVVVKPEGVVAALNAGLEHVNADVVAFTDDDAAPRPEWLECIERHFAADATLGGLGGRDWIYQRGAPENGCEKVVGRISWYGRAVGNHHLGTGMPREVDTLKGVNMSFRTEALRGIRFDSRLRGSGAQVGNELGVSLAVKKRGWKLIYDPQLAVDHFPSVRHDEDKRNTFSSIAIRNAAFNESLLLSEYLALPQSVLFLLWALLVGTRGTPGVVQWLRLLGSERHTATGRFIATAMGRVAGWVAAR